LNYGRILNNMRQQDAHFQELVATYQNTVLKAGEEVENGLVTFLRAQFEAKDYAKAVDAETAGFKLALTQYQGGLVDYNRVVLIQERLVNRQQSLAQAQGLIVQGLIQVYKALGGGWQIRLEPSPVAGPGSGAHLGEPIISATDKPVRQAVFGRPLPARGGPPNAGTPP
jgi:outer membrane protein TolC